VNALSPREAYRLWAPAYCAETAVSRLEDDLVRSLTPPLRGKRLLDAGCGTGRRLLGTGALDVVGVDLCPEMLDAGVGRGQLSATVRTAVADLRSLPIADHSFDVIWCRLAIGHVEDCGPVYAELARVAGAGATVIVSDFHPAAWAAGHRRTFRLGERVHMVEHHVHSVPAQLQAASSAGLNFVSADEACVGPSVRSFYDTSSQARRYEADLGLPLVLALRFRRAA
jgi:malonyl-CoA O-methyltransferase